MPAKINANTISGVPLCRKAGIAKPKAIMPSVTQISHWRRPILSAKMPEMLVKMPNTTAPIIKKPVNVLAAMPSPNGWPAADNAGALLENTCTNAVIT